MRRRKNTHIRPKHAARPDRHNTAVQNREVEVRVETVAQRDVAPVVDAEGRLDEGVGPAVAEDRFELRLPRRG
jgi:hypothetical protein